MFRFGIDTADLSAHVPGRAALVTAPAGRSADNRSSSEVLMEVCNLRHLLAPEHGANRSRRLQTSFKTSMLLRLSALRPEGAVTSAARPGICAESSAVSMPNRIIKTPLYKAADRK